MKKVLIFVLLLLLPSPVFSVNITNPQTVNSMKTEVIEKGTLEVNGKVNRIELNLSIPQDDFYQKMESLEVSDSNGNCNTNACSYNFVDDKFGNRVLKIIWKNPSANINFKVSSILSVRMRKSLENKLIPEFLLPTNLVQSTDTEIAELASKARGNDFERVSYLAKWVIQNIEYDKVYSDVTLSAKEILKTKRGVCKEFSNLLVSALRNLGYYSAVAVGYVYPGRVYLEKDFQPHGWIEVYTGNGIVADPTWAEVGYLDATHVKFATLPDSSWTYVSINANGEGVFKVNITWVDTKINILNFEEKPVINFNSSLLENNLWSGYAVVRTDITTDGCILTKIDSKSCTDENGGEFLKGLSIDNVIYFCNEKSFFSIFEIPGNLDISARYSCPIVISPYAGEQKYVSLSISFRQKESVKLAVDKTVLTSGEKLTVTSPNSHIFTDFGGYGFNKVEFYAPYNDFKVYAYNSGALAQQDISVVSSKPLDVFLQSNETAFVNKSIPVTITIKNLLDKNQTVTVKFRDKIISEDIIKSKVLTLNFTPKSVGDNLIQAFVSTSDFSTSASKTITILEEKSLTENVTDNIISFFGSILKAISDFFSWLFGLFK